MPAFETDFDPDDRELCEDGACTGVLGPDGICKECGRPRGGGPSVRASGGEAANDAEVSEGDFDPERQLCSDGACTGLIGPDGRCKVCGAAAAP